MVGLDGTTESSRQRWWALAVLAGAVLLLAIDGTVLALAVPSLVGDLDPTATQLLWIGDAYSFALAGLLVTMGTFADRIGRKRLLLAGAVAFGAASAAAALAPTAEALIAARVLLGVAGATIMPSTLSLIRSIFRDPVERTRAIAIWSAASGGGVAVGPLVGGALLERFWWGSVFLINVPVVLVLVVAGARLLPESRNPEPGRFDLVSSLLSMSAIVPIVYAFKRLFDGGPDAIVLAAAAIGLVSGVVFTHRQRLIDVPMIDVALFRNAAFSGALLANFIAIFALVGLLFFFSQYVQLARGFSPLRAGIAELPTTVASIAAVLFVGICSRRLGLGRAIAFGLALTAGGMLFVALAERADSYVWLALALVPVGLGVGLAMTLSTDAIVSAVEPERAGAASATAETAYELGVALGIAVLGSIVTLGYRQRLELPSGLPDGVRERVEDSLASAVTVVEPGSRIGREAIDAFVGAMQIGSIAAAIITGAAAVIAWLTIPSAATPAQEE